jgi:hypothetical protein
MTRQRQFFGGIGLAAIAFGIGLLLVPAVGSVGPVRQLLELVESVGTTRVLLLTGGGLIGYLLVGLRSPETGDSTGAAERFEAKGDTEGSRSPEITGYRLDQQVQTAIDDGGEAFAAVREQLQQTAVAVYADAVDCPEQQARAAITRGTWCSESLAASFLAEADGPSIPFGAQLRLFVFPRRERRRRIERTVAVIERVQGR